jgi:hypothetical protein
MPKQNIDCLQQEGKSGQSGFSSSGLPNKEWHRTEANVYILMPSILIPDKTLRVCDG